MPIVRLLFAGLAVIFGLILALCVAVAGMLIYVFSRLFGLSPKTSFKVNFQRGGASSPRQPTRMSRDDAIEIDAVEVPPASAPQGRLEP